MLLKLRSRLRYANVVSTVCLFIARRYLLRRGHRLHRQPEIKNNTVRSKDIRNNTVRGKDVRTGTLRTSDVADSSLLARDFAAGQLPAGPQGPGGPAGQDGFGLLTYQFGNADVANGADARPTADCPSGTSATGGSVYAYSPADISNVTNQVMTAQGSTSPTRLAGTRR